MTKYTIILFFACINMIKAQDFCATHKILKEKLNNESFYTHYQETRELLDAQLQFSKTESPTRGEVYVIPVVFHVLHNGGVENISREQILDALNLLNRDYRRLNPDADLVAPSFQGTPADIEVQFQLATKAPNGECFNGVTRTQSEQSFVEDGWSQVQAIIDGNDVYNGEWPGDQYLNIFICGEIGFGAAGYTYLPGSIGPVMQNGIWMLHDYVGSIGTSDESHSRVLTHEVGHWLDLPHTWGYTNDPGLPENCDSDDGIEDTPNTIGSTWCNLSQADCGPIANVENYMDYSYCSKMFTEGQKERMRSTLNSFVDGRNNLWTAQNIATTGADGNFYLCEAKFEQNKTNICPGESVQFTDLSFNVATSWTWYFDGGIPAMSTDQNPTVIFPNSGQFDVKLVVSDGITNDSIIKSNLISVLNESYSLPYYESFEDVSFLNETSGWLVSNPQLNETFKVSTFAGSTGTKSAYIENYFEFGETTDDLTSSPIDLSDVDSMVTLSFRFAYKRKPEIINEKLQVLVSSDCGETWQIKKTISGLLLTEEEEFDSYVPTGMNDWKQVHCTNILSSNFVPGFRYKFRFLGLGGNNIYIDDINLYEGPPSETIISQVGLEVMKNNEHNFNLYPNPSKDVLFIDYLSPSNDDIKIEIFSAIGDIVKSFQFEAKQNNSKITLNHLGIQSGVYQVRLIQNNQMVIKKLVIE